MKEVKLHVAVNKYLCMYNMEVVRQLETRVKAQLVVIYIPESWKLVAVKAEKVSRENLVEAARIVRKWVEDVHQNHNGGDVREKADRDL